MLTRGIIEVYKIGVPAVLLAPRYVTKPLGRLRMSDHTSLRRCTQCGESKPATTEYFYVDRSNKAGLTPQCIACRKAAWAANADVRNARARQKWADNREEINARLRARRAANRDAYNERTRQWKAANREKVNQANREWHAKNREAISEKARAKREANPQWAKDRANRWYVRHKESELPRRRELRQGNLTQYRKSGAAKERARQARKAELPSSYTTKQWQAALDYFGGCCAACGRQPGLFHTLAMDHWIPVSSPNCPGHIATNIVPLCHGMGGCNNSKSNQEPLEWALQKFGKRKGKEVVARIQTYFDAISIRGG